jgi:hypothetical protein
MWWHDPLSYIIITCTLALIALVVMLIITTV